MSFVATANPPIHGAEPMVGNDGFFPAVDCEALRNDIRLDGTVTAARLRLAVVDAMLAINTELQQWRIEQEHAGHATLGDVPSPMLGGESAKAHQYRKAIYAHVGAAVAEAYRDLDTLPQGAGKEHRVMSALETRVDSFHQQLRWTLADLQGKSRVIAELL